MRNLYIYILFIILFSGCSFSTPPNDWQYKSVNAFNSYTKNFLYSNDKIAKNDLQRAVSHAKNSANLNHLARIYLGKCALNISVGIDDRCQEYKDIKEIINSNTLDAYYDFLLSIITGKQIDKLPKIYQEFAWHMETKNFKKANTDILSMDRATSQILAASLLKNNIDKKSINKVIETASFHGYKKAVIFWLKKLKRITTDKKEVDKINKKISILGK